MSQFMELALRRQSCRNFSDKPISHETLVQIVEAARLAPSGCNAQPWSFVVAESPEAVAAVAKAGQQLGANAFLEKAQAFIIVLEEHAVLIPGIRKFLDSQYFAKGDMGAAAVSVCYAAADLGVGTCHIGLFDREQLGQILDIPAEKQYGILIALGYPADDKIRTKIRKDAAETVRFV
jgi:Nitroreductase